MDKSDTVHPNQATVSDFQKYNNRYVEILRREDDVKLNQLGQLHCSFVLDIDKQEHFQSLFGEEEDIKLKRTINGAGKRKRSGSVGKTGQD